jgi:hypothetical protein
VNVAESFVPGPFDINPGNNAALVSSVVTPIADVAVTKIGPASVVARVGRELLHHRLE